MIGSRERDLSLREGDQEMEERKRGKGGEKGIKMYCVHVSTPTRSVIIMQRKHVLTTKKN